VKSSGSNRGLLLALVIAAAAAVGVYVFIGSSREEAQPVAALPAPTQVPTTGVLIAKQDIAASTLLTAEMVEVKQVATDVKNERALIQPDQAVGKTTSVALMRGEQILNSRVETQVAAPDTFAQEVPIGKRAFSVVYDEVIGAGALVQPGDHVDVLAHFEIDVDDATIEEKESKSDRAARDDEGDNGDDGDASSEEDVQKAESDYTQYVTTYIVQDVEVLWVAQAVTPDQLGVGGQAVLPTPIPQEEVGQDAADKDEAGQDEAEDPKANDPKARPEAKSATLAVTPEQLQRLVLATQTVKNQSQGNASLRLALRAPGDTTVVDLPRAQLGEIPVGGLLGNVDVAMTPAELAITDVAFTKRLLNSGEILEFRATLKNTSDHEIRSGKDAPPEFTYTQGVAYDTLGFVPEVGTYRIGLNVSGAFPTQFPYRWSLGRNLKPGETMELVGSVQLTEPTPETQYWLGVILEPGVVTQDGVGVADVTVLASSALTVKDATVQLRKDPNTAGEVVRDVEQGAELKVKDVQGGWYQVVIDGEEGWVPAAAMEAEPASEDGKPTTPAGDPELVAKRIRERFDPWNREND